MDINCITCKHGSYTTAGLGECPPCDDPFTDWQPIEEKSKKDDNKSSAPEDTSTKNKITTICNNIKDLLHYKNHKYGDSALNPINIFSKLTGEEAIKIRLDDKISRIQNSTELRKNDICDLIGYLILLCISKGWTTFNEYKD